MLETPRVYAVERLLACGPPAARHVRRQHGDASVGAGLANRPTDDRT